MLGGRSGVFLRVVLDFAAPCSSVRSTTLVKCYVFVDRKLTC